MQEKILPCFICFGIGNLSNFAVVKSLHKFWGCLLDNNTLYIWKPVLSSLILFLSRQRWNSLKLILCLGSMFWWLQCYRYPQLYPHDFVDLFIRNYFWFLDDLFHKWLHNFDIELFYSMNNNLDTNLKFILENFLNL